MNRDVLNIYDATFNAANAKAIKDNDQKLNNGVVELARSFNILGEAIDRVEILLGKIGEKGLLQDTTILDGGLLMGPTLALEQKEKVLTT